MFAKILKKLKNVLLFKNTFNIPVINKGRRIYNNSFGNLYFKKKTGSKTIIGRYVIYNSKGFEKNTYPLKNKFESIAKSINPTLNYIYFPFKFNSKFSKYSLQNIF